MKIKTSDKGKTRDSAMRRRLNLMKLDPHCFWCKRKLSLYYYLSDGKLPDDFPTIDHLNSREVKRYRPLHGVRVLSCPPCNVGRARELQQKYIWVTRWKAANFPFPFRWVGKILQVYRSKKYGIRFR